MFCVEARRSPSFREGRLLEPSESLVTCEVLGVNGFRQVLIRRDLADPLGSLQDENLGKRSSRQKKPVNRGIDVSVSDSPSPRPRHRRG